MEKSEIAEKEEEILKFWQENKIFEKSVEKPAGKEPVGNFVFYDGPPFATGLPHFGHLLPTSLKDVIPRYQTMRGKRVARRWGWDCHGLPIENLIEKELGLKNKKEIEQYGLELFNQKARESVLRYADEWKKIIPRMGRWVDMENDYKTMNPSYTERVWWVFKTLYDKGLVYEGYKSMHLCPRCETTLANFEVNQGYKDITDLSVYVKFELVDEPGTFLLAWTTTPWTLPGNVALVINEKIVYVKLKVENENLILAKNKLAEVLKEQKFEIIEEFTGDKLVGKKYKPLFDYYSSNRGSTLKDAQGRTSVSDAGWRIYSADFVNTEEGTGVVHIAPAFGEDDLKLGEEKKLPFIQHVARDGHFKPEVTDFAGLSVKPKSDDEKTRLEADIAVIKYLQAHNNYFDKKKITHSYPHCWRCDTPLLNYASSSWFIKVTDLKEKLLAENSKVNWIPEHIRDGRFGKWLEGARDWAVSRQRFWGAPLPIWRCVECKKIKVFSGIEDLKKSVKKSGNKYFVMRHGEAENNVLEILSSRYDNPHHLTDRGQEQVKDSAKKIKELGIDLIISSDFIRTRETAELVAKELGFDINQIIYDARLREVNHGDLNGQPIKFYDEYYRNGKKDFAESPPNGESYADVKKRMGGMLYDLEYKYENKKVLVITHESPVWLLFAASLGCNSLESFAVRPLNQYFFKNAEVRELSFIPLPHNHDYELDFHRPFIDEVKIICECGAEMKRIEDVFDVWFESGSMPYNEPSFPADFIAEGLDQTRGWFYSLLVLGVGLFEKSPYKNVIVNGLILAEDGQKMSKRLSNYPDLNLMINKYGADAIRFYLLSSPAVRAEDFSFSERGLGEVMRRVIMRLKNVLAFYELYDPVRSGEGTQQASTSNGMLDTWMTSRLNELNITLTSALDNYEIDQMGKPLDQFIDDLSTWFLRRSRERFKSDNAMVRATVIHTTRHILLTLAKLIAPIMPFMAEEIFQALRASSDAESVHLTAWPEAGQVDSNLLTQMSEVRKIVSLGLEARAQAGIKVRQPLNKLKVKSEGQSLAGFKDCPSDFLDLIKNEVNVKAVEFVEKLEKEVELDTQITPELKLEGEARDLMRALQDWRKEKNFDPKTKIKLQIRTDKRAQDLIKQFEAEIKRITLITEIKFVAENIGDKIVICDLEFVISSF